MRAGRLGLEVFERGKVPLVEHVGWELVAQSRHVALTIPRMVDGNTARPPRRILEVPEVERSGERRSALLFKLARHVVFLE